MKGIILAGGSGTRLYPCTIAVSKQLQAIYDKPLIYYPISTLMLAGIRDILIITTPDDQKSFQKLLGDGSNFGTNFSYEVQPSPDGLAQAFLIGEEFIKNEPCALALGDNIFFGSDFVKRLQEAKEDASNGYAINFGIKVNDPERFGVIEFDEETKQVLSIEEKPKHPKSKYAVPGLYFYPSGVSELAKQVVPSERGELEITSLNEMYLKAGLLKANLLGGGYAWFDTGTTDSMLEASDFISKAQKRNNNEVIACLEQIGFHQGWLDIEVLQQRADLMKKNQYGAFLQKTAEEGRARMRVRMP